MRGQRLGSCWMSEVFELGVKTLGKCLSWNRKCPANITSVRPSLEIRPRKHEKLLSNLQTLIKTSPNNGQKFPSQPGLPNNKQQNRRSSQIFPKKDLKPFKKPSTLPVTRIYSLYSAQTSPFWGPCPVAGRSWASRRAIPLKRSGGLSSSLPWLSHAVLSGEKVDGWGVCFLLVSLSYFLLVAWKLGSVFFFFESLVVWGDSVASWLVSI